jgi:thiol-disulfide isomerase/thioredoxin
MKCSLHALLATCIALASTASAQQESRPVGAAPANIAGRDVVLSPKAKEVLDRAGAAYHALKTYQNQTEVEQVFVLSAANGKSTRLPSYRSSRFAYAGARRYTLRNQSHSIYCCDEVFTNQIRTNTDGSGKIVDEKEVTKLAPTGPVDWADCMGNIAQMLTPNPAEALLMTGGGAGLELFLAADEVESGELDERAGVWVVGKGVSPYTFGSPGGGVDVVPIRAWFSSKTGLLREVRYDISRTSWAMGAAEGFGARNGGKGSVVATVTVRLGKVKLDEPIDDSLFVYSADAPSGGRFEREGMPSMGMGGKPMTPAAAAPAGMTPAKPAGMTPATPTAAGGPAAMTPATPVTTATGPAAMTPAKPIDTTPGETITSGETLRNKLLDLPAPAFATLTPDGKPIALSDFKGKVVLLDFWATWCGPCMQAIPAIQRLSEKFKDQPVAIVGVNRDKEGDESKVKRTIERKQLTFHQAMDTPGTIAKSYKITAIPALILIDKEGVVRQVHVGYGPGEEEVLAAEIEKLLKGEKLEPIH